MVVGIKKIIGKMTMGDEYGLYRRTEEGSQYLLFVVTTYRDLVKHGRFLAKYFGVMFENYVPEPEQPEPEDGEEIKINPSPELMNALDALLPEDKLTEIDPWVQPMLDHQNQKNKPRRVSGVARKVKPLIVEGKTDEEIFQFMLPDYAAVGRTEKEARELLLPYLKDIRAGKY